ncbi:MULTISPECIES: peptide chain release factor N(5)-glutamine methyltransferase [Treponema]|uniref:peptide chain release factor N(5)-glutamine methyltransferase n=1 Tax=Treponema TaxID=157 RepID=UPI00257D9023|nr:peptide chain release factor N(5)-glutamine methyltransferase [Treponema sp.]MBQ5537102.1 peptide chain release factor N(5)-glutamine methyltransferase [Treponema sp.]
MNIYEIRTKAVREIGKAGSDTPELDADLIIGDVLAQNRTWILFHRNSQLTDEQAEKIDSAIRKRTEGLPVAYITGKKEFYGYEFIVTPDVLIPKPDTETLVDFALSAVTSETKSICDLCSGSGCVGLSIYSALLDSGIKYSSIPNFTFVDISQAALDISKRNAAKLLNPISVQKISFAKSDILENISGTFDIIVTNPPYIPSGEAAELLKDGRNEPLLALDGLSEDGLGIIRNLIPQSLAHLNEGGLLAMETGEYNAEKAAELMREAGFRDVAIEKDLAGLLRVVHGRK